MKNIIFASPLATLALVGTMAAVMTGCATKPTYQNPTQSVPKIMTNAQGVPNYYQVQRGDTVSQIASRYRLNYRQVGALNNLDSKYTIYSGQMLKLWQGGQATPTNKRPSKNTSGNNNVNAYQGGTNTSVTTSQPSYNSTPSPTLNYQVTANSTSGYEYPTRNKVIRNFDASAGNMGMWFTGKEGDSVIASQAGTVLYAGNGLPEYGSLIMIGHSGNYITAYAHNSRLLVKEGDTVQRAQPIATMGSSGQTNEVALQFQVRLNGNPIDPRAVLGR